jgi:hypothetical protein
MIKRIWRGWASVDNAEEYEQLLNMTIVPGITARCIAGHRGTEISRERDPEGTEVQFVTIMTFDGWEAVREFAGGDGHASVVPRRLEHCTRASMSTPLTSTSPATIPPPASTQSSANRRPEAPRWRRASSSGPSVRTACGGRRRREGRVAWLLRRHTEM